MLSLYGQPDMDGVGIPIIDKVPKTLEEMYVGRAKTGACYQAIIDDLDRAVGLLTQTDNHRVTVWSAKAFRAKACLFAGQNDKAKTDLEDRIHNSGKTLEPFERYRMMFNGYDEYEFNSESFYEMANKADPTNGSAYGNQNTGSTLSLYYPPFCIAPRQHADGHVLRQPGTCTTATCRASATPTPRRSPKGTSLSETKPDGSLRYSLSEEYMDQQLAHRKKLGKWEPGEPDPRLFVCSLQPFVDSVQMTIDGVNAYRKVAQVEFNKWWEMDPNTGNDPRPSTAGPCGNTTISTAIWPTPRATSPVTTSIHPPAGDLPDVRLSAERLPIRPRRWNMSTK